MVKRVPGGAHYGLRGWLMQRVSAVVMALFTLALAGFLLSHQPLRFADWQALFQPHWMRLLTLLFFLSLYLHAWVGMRDILMDYIKPTLLRLGLHVAVLLLLGAYAIWTAQILWSV
ncbi:MAG: succinate dehydrogenase, hydrophobic membrane anchor protein [Burkholderiales bacterium]